MPYLQEQFKSVVAIPALPRSDTAIHLHGETIPDPYDYLKGYAEYVKDRAKYLQAHPEDKVFQKVDSWLAKQEERYQEYTANPSGKEETEALLAEAFNQPEKGIPQKAGDKYLFYYKPAGAEKAQIMISDTAEGTGSPLIDPGKQQFGGAFISPDGKYLAYLLHEPGGWEADIRIKDLATGKDLPDVARGGTLWWDKDGKGFSYNFQSRDEPKRMIVQHHAIGAKNDTVAYDGGVAGSSGGPPGGMRNHASYDGQQEWFFWGGGIGVSNLKSGVAMKDPKTGQMHKLFDPGEVEIYPIADRGDGILVWTTESAPNGRVALMDPKNPDPANWKTVIPEGNDALVHVFAHQGKLMALYNRNCAEELNEFDMQGNPLGKLDMGAPSALNFSHASMPGSSLGQRAPVGDELFFKATSFTQAPTVYRYDADAKKAVSLDPKPPGPDLSDCLVEQIWATSKDDTKTPMTVIRRKDVKLDGTAALKLTGYGGFGSSQGPTYDPEMLDFVRSGGIFVQTNVRGGGEFGEPWHEGGRGRKKQNAIDDFNASAQHLIDNRYTSASRIVSEGHSNGGMLVLSAALQRPELYGAVIASAPVADMLAGNQKKEYGSPFEDEGDFRAVMGYSAVHNIDKDKKYPPIQIRTSEKDWLLPQAIKFVETMRETSPESTVLLHYEKGQGHNTHRSPSVAINEIIAKKAFIERSIGPLDQQSVPALAQRSSPKASQYNS